MRRAAKVLALLLVLTGLGHMMWSRALPSLDQAWEHKMQDEYNWVQVTPDGAYLYFRDKSKLTFLDSVSGKVATEYEGSSYPLFFNSNGRTIVSYDGAYHVMQGSQLTRTVETPIEAGQVCRITDDYYLFKQRGLITCYDKQFNKRWKFKGIDWLNEGEHGGKVVGTSAGGHAVCLDAATGDLLWYERSEGSQSDGPIILLRGSKVRCVDTAKRTLWEFDAGEKVSYAECHADMNWLFGAHHLFSMSADGKLRFKKRLGTSDQLMWRGVSGEMAIIQTSVTESPIPLIRPSEEEYQVYTAYSPAGRRLWRLKLSGSAHDVSAHGDYVYVVFGKLIKAYELGPKRLF